VFSDFTLQNQKVLFLVTLIRNLRAAGLKWWWHWN